MTRTRYSTWDPQWSALEDEIFRDYGHAAFVAQMLESSLVTILLAADNAGHIELNKKGDLESEIFLSKKTLGQLKAELSRINVQPEMLAILTDAVEARNYLIHSFFIWNSENYLTDEGRGVMLTELKTLRFKIGRAKEVFFQIRESVVESIYRITLNDLQTLYESYQIQKKMSEIPETNNNQ